MYNSNEAVLDYLVTEGYADDYNSALYILESMSDEWYEQITEGFVPLTKAKYERVRRAADNIHANLTKRLPELTSATQKAEKAEKHAKGRMKSPLRHILGTSGPIKRARQARQDATTLGKRMLNRATAAGHARDAMSDYYAGEKARLIKKINDLERGED